MAADVWEKDVWEFQAKSGSSGSCRLFLHFLGKIAVREMSGKPPGTPRHPSSRHPRPSDLKRFAGVAPVSRYTPLKSVAPKFESEKVSRYTGVSQLQLRVWRYTVQLPKGPRHTKNNTRSEFTIRSKLTTRSDSLLKT